MDEGAIRKMLQTSNQVRLRLEGEIEPNIHALDDVLNYMKGNTNIHIKTSMKTIKDLCITENNNFLPSVITFFPGYA